MLFFFLTMALGLIAPARLRADGGSGGIVPGEILVGLRAGSTTPVRAQIATGVGQVMGYQPALRTLRLRLRPGLGLQTAIALLRRNANVFYAEPNHILRACATPDDAYYTRQYAPGRVQADRSWDIWQPQARVVLAIVDTGVDSTHPDLTDVMDRDPATGAVVGYNSLDGSSNALDDYGHGTHCAGIAAAHINNGLGIAGIAGWNPNVPASDTYIRLMPVKVLSKNGEGTDAEVADGIVWATDHGAGVISMSLGESSYSDTLNNAVQYAWNNGVVIVAAAGNAGSANLFYPAAYPNVLSVAATDRNDSLAPFSDYGSWVKVAAPGVGIYATTPTYPASHGFPLNYATLSGTSMATPCVAGEAAAILAQNPILSNSEVGTLITANVDPYRPYQNHTLPLEVGRANVYRAVQAAGTGSPSLTAVAAAPTAIPGGATASLTVFLGGRAPAGGVLVMLVSSNTSLAPVPDSILIPEGTTSATFSVPTGAVSAAKPVLITGSDGTVTQTAVLTVIPVALQSLTFSPSPVTGGASTTGTVALNGPAPSGGIVVVLSSGNVALADPAVSSITIPAGSMAGTFTLNTSAVTAATKVTLSATANRRRVSAALIVTP